VRVGPKALRTHLNFIVKTIGSFFFTGYFPVAPATFASLVFALIYWLVPGGTFIAHPVVFALTLIASVPVAGRMEKQYGSDPSCAVIDEVVGMQALLVGASPAGAMGLAVGFVLFRMFDILKPFPINRSQGLPGGWGIVMDDLIAGIYSRIAVILLSLLFPSLGSFLPWTS
jgi:phosphatidylglycerophosphatase A